jgi:hypothetical protein
MRVLDATSRSATKSQVRPLATGTDPAGYEPGGVFGPSLITIRPAAICSSLATRCRRSRAGMSRTIGRNRSDWVTNQWGRHGHL